MLSALVAEGAPPTSPLAPSLSFPSPTRSCHPLAVPLPAATRSRRGARGRSRRWRWHLPYLRSAVARRELQQEDFGGACGDGRRRSFHFCRAPGNWGSCRCGRPGETGARPSEGEWEENRSRSGCCSFVVPPSRTATGQQEQEGPRCPRGHCLHFREAPSGGFTSSGSIMALARETGTPTTGLHLGRGMVYLHHPCACRGPGPPPPSVPVHSVVGMT
jgi:hypothetical protein